MTIRGVSLMKKYLFDFAHFINFLEVKPQSSIKLIIGFLLFVVVNIGSYFINGKFDLKAFLLSIVLYVVVYFLLPKRENERKIN